MKTLAFAIAFLLTFFGSIDFAMGTHILQQLARLVGLG